MDDESWDYFLSQINRCEDIDEIEKQELLRNWGYLRACLKIRFAHLYGRSVELTTPHID
jgi:hypothetical protein